MKHKTLSPIEAAKEFRTLIKGDDDLLTRALNIEAFEIADDVIAFKEFLDLGNAISKFAQEQETDGPQIDKMSLTIKTPPGKVLERDLPGGGVFRLTQMEMSLHGVFWDLPAGMLGFQIGNDMIKTKAGTWPPEIEDCRSFLFRRNKALGLVMPFTEPDESWGSIGEALAHVVAEREKLRHLESCAIDRDQMCQLPEAKAKHFAQYFSKLWHTDIDSRKVRRALSRFVDREGVLKEPIKASDNGDYQVAHADIPAILDYLEGKLRH